MTETVIVSGSPAPSSRSLLVCKQLCVHMNDAGAPAEVLDVRDIPAENLVRWRDGGATAVRAATTTIEEADAVVLVTPIYRAAYSGALKAFLDVLPQFAFAGKIVLPVCTAGSVAHLLAIDYGLRPVLASMGCPNVLRGMFLLDTSIPRDLADITDFDDETAERVESAVEDLTRALAHASALLDRSSMMVEVGI